MLLHGRKMNYKNWSDQDIGVLFQFIFTMEVFCFFHISVAFFLPCHYADSSFCIGLFPHFFSLGLMNINFTSAKDYCTQIMLFYFFFSSFFFFLPVAADFIVKIHIQNEKEKNKKKNSTKMLEYQPIAPSSFRNITGMVNFI